VIVGGEADSQAVSALATTFAGRVTLIQDLPLPALGALLARSTAFVGHDSGISHLAAAVGAPCVLLFGPTDPAIWAPANPGVRVLTAPDGDLAKIAVEQVAEALECSA
jgi:heptosyltransferase-2